MEKNWSQDYVEHLRAAHFVLVLLCVAAIGLALSPRKTQPSVAREQLEQVRQVLDTWNEKFLQVVARDSTEDLLDNGIYSAKIPDRPAILRVKVKPPASFVILKPPTEARWRSDCDGPSGEKYPTHVGDVIPRPATLGDFVDVWDRLANGGMLRQPVWSLGAFFRGRKEDRSQIRELSLSSANPKRAKNAEEVLVQIQCLVPQSRDAMNAHNPTEEVKTSYQMHGLLDNFYELYFPVEIVDLPTQVDAQGLLMPHHGKFADVFHELSLAMAGIRHASSLTIGEAEDKIPFLEEVPAGSLEAFGTQFPANVSLGLGIVVVICVQLYLWVQLFEFKRRPGPKEPGRDVAWIGIYDSKPARALAIISLIMLPVATVTTVGIRGLIFYRCVWWSWVALVLALLVAGAISVLTHRVLEDISGDRLTLPPS